MIGLILQPIDWQITDYKTWFCVFEELVETLIKHYLGLLTLMVFQTGVTGFLLWTQKMTFWGGKVCGTHSGSQLGQMLFFSTAITAEVNITVSAHVLQLLWKHSFSPLGFQNKTLSVKLWDESQYTLLFERLRSLWWHWHSKMQSKQ